MLTADTITDEQIRELQSRAAADDDLATWTTAQVARGIGRDVTAANRTEARARIAEILNARAKVVVAPPTGPVVIDSSQVMPTVIASLKAQMLAELNVILTDRQARAIAANITMGVLGLELDETHVIDTADAVFAQRIHNHAAQEG
jgi:hypothetical protein